MAAPVLFMVGCATAPRAAPSEAPLPGPSNFAVDPAADLDLPVAVAAEARVPPQLRASLHAEAHGEAVGRRPLHSTLAGHLTLLVTDPPGDHRYVNFDLTVRGDGDGSPTEGLLQAATQLADAVAPAVRPVQAPAR